MKMDFNYDERYDIGYVTFYDSDNCYGEHMDGEFENIVMMKDMETHEIKGITIFDYEKTFMESQERRIWFNEEYEYQSVCAGNSIITLPNRISKKVSIIVDGTKITGGYGNPIEPYRQTSRDFIQNIDYKIYNDYHKPTRLHFKGKDRNLI